MKTINILTILLVCALPLHAETYSWLDESGTYNFSDDLASVPKKYRKKVKRRDDLPQEMSATQQKPSSYEKATGGQTLKGDGKSEPTDVAKEMYGGKTRAEWRFEMDAREAELNSLEQQMTSLRKQLDDENKAGMSKGTFNALKTEYNERRTFYNQKYKIYTELVETIRKAGIPVEIKSR